MLIQETANPDIIHIRDSIGYVRLFGIVLLALGILGLTGTVMGFVGRPGNIERIAFGLGFGSVFTLIGALLCFSTSAVEINRQEGTLIEMFSVLGFSSRKHHRLEAFSEVSLVKEWNTSKYGPEWLYRIVLTPVEKKASPLNFGYAADESSARVAQYRLAAFLNLPAVDAMSGD